MKKITILLLALSILLSSKSFASKLKVYSFDNSLIKVVIDNRVYTGFSRFVNLNRLSPGIHNIKILKLQPYGMRLNPKSKIAYRGIIRVPANSNVIVKLNRFRDLDIEITRYQNLCEQEYYNDNNICNSGIQNINNLLYIIDKASFDNDKLTIARQAVRQNGVYANQVLQIMDMFNFESTKLKFAKFAYKYCIDRNNYYMVNQGFSFNSSIKSLDNYIYRNF